MHGNGTESRTSHNGLQFITKVADDNERVRETTTNRYLLSVGNCIFEWTIIVRFVCNAQIPNVVVVWWWWWWFSRCACVYLPIITSYYGRHQLLWFIYCVNLHRITIALFLFTLSANARALYPSGCGFVSPFSKFFLFHFLCVIFSGCVHQTLCHEAHLHLFIHPFILVGGLFAITLPGNSSLIHPTC